MKIKANIENLINHSNIKESNLIKATKEFYNFPERLHNFELESETEHYVEIKFLNYQKTRCSVLYQKDFNEIRLSKGIGGVNFDYVKLINNLIELGIFEIE